MKSIKKEKSEKQMTVMVQPSLYEFFEKKCIDDFRSVSEVLRELMSKYAKGWIQSPNTIKDIAVSKELSLSEEQYANIHKSGYISVIVTPVEEEDDKSFFMGLVSLPEVGDRILDCRSEDKTISWEVTRIYHSITNDASISGIPVSLPTIAVKKFAESE